MDQYLFGLVIIELCECGARCRRLFDFEWDDEMDNMPLDHCPRCSKIKWPRIDDVRFYNP